MSNSTTKLMTAAAFATLAFTAFTPAEARMSLNGQFQNGVSHQGVEVNGQFSNGQFSNGQFSNGQFSNGVSHQGAEINGIGENGSGENGSTTRGLGRTLNGYVVLDVILPGVTSDQSAVDE